MRAPGTERTSSLMDADCACLCSRTGQNGGVFAIWAGKEKMLSMGTYPDVPLAEARKRRDEARRKLQGAIDPAAERRLADDAPDRTFEAVGRHYLAGLERKVLLKK